MAPVKPVPITKAQSTATTTTTSSPTLSSSNSSSRFLLPQEHQRKDVNITASLNSTCARVMKETEATIEVSVSSQTKAISFVVSGKPASIKSAKRLLWSLLAQNVSLIKIKNVLFYLLF